MSYIHTCDAPGALHLAVLIARGLPPLTLPMTFPSQIPRGLLLCFSFPPTNTSPECKMHPLPASPEPNYPPGPREYSSASYVSPQHVMAFARPKTIQPATARKNTPPNGALTPSQITFRFSSVQHRSARGLPSPLLLQKTTTPDSAMTPPPSAFPPQTNYSTGLHGSSPRGL